MRALKIESLERKGWYDRDIILLHASFQILKDCVEKESLFEHSTHYAKSKNGKIAKKLYDWWEVRRLQEEVIDGDESYEFDTKQLIKLMKIRGGLWT